MIIPLRQRAPTFWIGANVFLTNADEPIKGVIISVIFTDRSERYEVGWPSAESTVHYEFELTTEFIPNFPQNEDE